MFDQALSLLFTFLLFEFLILIHELGHYWAAKVVGMTVEVFSIGMGKAICSWKRGKVEWRIGLLPIGGFVKILGQEEEGKKNLRTIPGGFYSKSPWARIFVAFMGPCANFAFALFLFGLFWLAGGKEEPFSQYTNRVGWIDPSSHLYEKGVRIGDEITSYNGMAFEGAEDHLIAGWLSSNHQIEVTGFHRNSFTEERQFFSYLVTPHREYLGDRELKTSGILESARFLIYTHPQKEEESDHHALQRYVEQGDRILWANGEMIYSYRQLFQIMQKPTVLLRIEREGTEELVQVPLTTLNQLKLSREEREDLLDLFLPTEEERGEDSLFLLPYRVNEELKVEGEYECEEKSESIKLFTQDAPSLRYRLDSLLQPQDRILSINGEPVSSLGECIRRCQKRVLLLILQRASQKWPQVSYTQGDRLFSQLSHTEELQDLLHELRHSEQVESTQHLLLLPPIPLQPRSSFYTLADEEKIQNARRSQLKKNIDLQEREALLQKYRKIDQQLILGVMTLGDLAVLYRPPPHTLFFHLVRKMFFVLLSLVSGSLPVDSLSGPVGILHAVHSQIPLGGSHLLFWIGMISINLGFVNLIPLPILDGGHILFSLFELLFRRPICPTLMRKLSFLSLFLLMTLFFFITFHDICRLGMRFFLS